MDCGLMAGRKEISNRRRTGELRARSRGHTERESELRKYKRKREERRSEGTKEE